MPRRRMNIISLRGRHIGHVFVTTWRSMWRRSSALRTKAHHTWRSKGSWRMRITRIVRRHGRKRRHGDIARMRRRHVHHVRIVASIVRRSHETGMITSHWWGRAGISHHRMRRAAMHGWMHSLHPLLRVGNGTTRSRLLLGSCRFSGITTIGWLFGACWRSILFLLFRCLRRSIQIFWRLGSSFIQTGRTRSFIYNLCRIRGRRSSIRINNWKDLSITRTNTYLSCLRWPNPFH